MINSQSHKPKALFNAWCQETLFNPVIDSKQSVESYILPCIQNTIPTLSLLSVSYSTGLFVVDDICWWGHLSGPCAHRSALTSSAPGRGWRARTLGILLRLQKPCKDFRLSLSPAEESIIETDRMSRNRSDHTEIKGRRLQNVTHQ